MQSRQSTNEKKTNPRPTPLQSPKKQEYELGIYLNGKTESSEIEDVFEQSKNRMQLIANLVPDLLWDSEPNGSTNWYNDRWLEYTGQKFEEAIGWGWVDAIHPEDRKLSEVCYANAVASGEPLIQEHRIRKFDGQYRWFLVNSHPLKNQDGEVVKMYGAATDIHDRRLAEQAAIENEKRQEILLQLSDLLRPMTEPRTIASSVARILTEAIGANRVVLFEMVETKTDCKLNTLGQYPVDLPVFPAKLSYKEYKTIFSTELKAVNELLIVDDLANIQRLSSEMYSLVDEIKISAVVAIQFIINLNTKIHLLMLNHSARKWTRAEINLFTDVAERTRETLERVRYEKILIKKERKLEKIQADKKLEAFRDSLNILEKERHRISESLHNGVAQLIYAAKLSIGDIKPASEISAFRDAQHNALLLINEAIAETRRISHQLMPTTLENFGLASALNDICKQLSHGTVFSVDLDGIELRLDKYMELVVYRTVQELLMNVHKHAQAKACKAYVQLQRENINICVEDNGIGFKTSLPQMHGIGLDSIRGKINLLGGAFAIQSAKGQGTKVTISIPLPSRIGRQRGTTKTKINSKKKS